MKNNLIWAKTILSVYRYLERICGAIDKIMLQSALGSSNILGQNYFYNNTYAISQRLIDLSERKVTLINLKLLTDETLKSLKPKTARMLIERYFEGKKVKDMAEQEQTTIRTVFRRISLAEEKFGATLQKNGYNDFHLRKLLEHEQWIKNVYESMSSKNSENFCLSGRLLDKAVSM